MTHPLQEEPDPKVIAMVRRFGLVGLIVCAVLASARRLLRRTLNIHMARVRTPYLRPETIVQSRK